MIDKEILDSVLGNDCAEEKQEKDEESEVNDKPQRLQAQQSCLNAGLVLTTVETKSLLLIHALVI